MDLKEQFPLDEILSQFVFEGKYLRHMAFGTGHIHHTFKITFEKDSDIKEYLLQRINTDTFHKPNALMSNIERVSKHLQSKYRYLADKERRFLELIPTKNQANFYLDRSDKYWRAYYFINNTYSLDWVESPEQAYQAARAFAIFVKDLMDIEITQFQETIPNFHHLGSRYQHFLIARQKANPQRLKEANLALDLIEKNNSLVAEVESIITQLPLRLVHNDTKINNVLLDKASHKGLCVVDLDTIMPGYLLYDFGDMMRTFLSPVPEDCPDLALVKIRQDIFMALSQGYLEVLGKKMHPLEREHLFLGGKLMTYIMAIRFLSDFLEGDPYYKIHYPLHNLDRAMNQLELLKNLNEQEFALRKILEDTFKNCGI